MKYNSFAPCPTPHKRRYSNKNDAKYAVTESDKKYKKLSYFYSCKCGYFHLTTQDLSNREGRASYFDLNPDGKIAVQKILRAYGLKLEAIRGSVRLHKNNQSKRGLYLTRKDKMIIVNAEDFLIDVWTYK